MFHRLIDDFKDSTATALRLTSLAAAAAIALLVTTAFLCAAAFVLETTTGLQSARVVLLNPSNDSFPQQATN